MVPACPPITDTSVVTGSVPWFSPCRKEGKVRGWVRLGLEKSRVWVKSRLRKGIAGLE